MFHPFHGRFGYRPNPAHADRLHARMQPRFGGAHAAMAAEDDGGDRYLYRALVVCLKAAGIAGWVVKDSGYERLNTYVQGDTNTCHGNANAMRLAIARAVEIVLRGADEAYMAMPAPEVLAAFCQEIDGTLGSDYGGSGSGEVEGLEKFGAAYAVPIGSYDLSAGNYADGDVAGYQGRVAQFTRDGVPGEIRAFAKEHLSLAHVRVDDTAQLWADLGAGYPCLVCSNLAFATTRNEEGISVRSSGSWAHAMCISSRRTSAKYGRLFLVHNSWTPAWISGPTWQDQPIGSFWALEKDVAEMLTCRWSRRQTIRDSWISTGAKGFVPRADLLPHWITILAA